MRYAHLVSKQIAASRESGELRLAFALYREMHSAGFRRNLGASAPLQRMIDFLAGRIALETATSQRPEIVRIAEAFGLYDRTRALNVVWQPRRGPTAARMHIWPHGHRWPTGSGPGFDHPEDRALCGYRIGRGERALHGQWQKCLADREHLIAIQERQRELEGREDPPDVPESYAEARALAASARQICPVCLHDGAMYADTRSPGLAPDSRYSRGSLEQVPEPPPLSWWRWRHLCSDFEHDLERRLRGDVAVQGEKQLLTWARKHFRELVDQALLERITADPEAVLRRIIARQGARRRFEKLERRVQRRSRGFSAAQLVRRGDWEGLLRGSWPQRQLYRESLSVGEQDPVLGLAALLAERLEELIDTRREQSQS